MPLPEPRGKQKEVLALPTTGHFVVLGTAGSGKTTLAIHRAAYLADKSLPGSGPTLLLTFNNALVAYLRSLGNESLGDVTVETYHRFARGYLNSRGAMRNNFIAGPGARRRLIGEALSELAEDNPREAVLRRPPSFFERELDWIQQYGIASTEDYVTSERVGRGIGLDRRSRPLVFKVLERYEELRNAEGYPYDWESLPSHALVHFLQDKTERKYRHIVVDEGQDFSPEMLRAVAAAIPDNGSLTFFGDAAQQIYGNGVSWKSAGLKVVGGVWEFQENYRNTGEIARLALAISRMPYFTGVADLVEPRLPRAEGPMPTLVRFSDLRAECEFLNARASEIPAGQSLAILFKDRSSESRLRKSLREKATRLDRDLEQFAAAPGVYYGTFHAAKGLEFDNVVIPFLHELIAHPDDIAGLGEEEAATYMGKLLYVGVTRCRFNLVMTQVGEESQLLPPADRLFTIADRRRVG